MVKETLTSVKLQSALYKDMAPPSVHLVPQLYVDHTHWKMWGSAMSSGMKVKPGKTAWEETSNIVLLHHHPQKTDIVE